MVEIDRVKAMHILGDMVSLDINDIKSNDIVLGHIVMNKEEDEQGNRFFYALGEDKVIRRIIEDSNGRIKLIDNEQNVHGKDPYLIRGDLVFVYDTDGKEYTVSKEMFNSYLQEEGD